MEIILSPKLQRKKNYYHRYGVNVREFKSESNGVGRYTGRLFEGPPGGAESKGDLSFTTNFCAGNDNRSRAALARAI